MRYLDFLLHLQSAGNGEVTISVPTSPSGEGGGSYTADTTDGGVEAGLPPVGRCRLRDLVQQGGGPRQLAAAERGAALYRALLPAALRDLYIRSVEVARQQKKGLRLKILLDPRDPGARELQGLPWELLFRDDTQEFLALDPDTPVVRALVVPRPARRSILAGRVRVLAAQALPRGTQPLDLARELEEMSGGQGSNVRHPGVQVVQWRARRETLRQTLEDSGPFDVFHFLGHASFHPESGEGVLLFEGAGGREEPVHGKDFATTLAGFSDLRLVVLNACKTGRASLTPSAAPFGGVAAALLQAGMPAVIAMQDVVADAAAVRFSRALYHHLARQRSLEEAVTEGRLAISARSRGGEWSVPILFLRASPASDGGDPAAAVDQSDDATHLIETGIDLFASGDYDLGERRLEEALVRSPGSERARLFAILTRAGRGIVSRGPLPASAVIEIAGALHTLWLSKDGEVSRLAGVAFAILRFDVVDPRRIRVQGPSFNDLASQLAGRPDMPIEHAVARALAASPGVRMLLNISR